MKRIFCLMNPSRFSFTHRILFLVCFLPSLHTIAHTTWTGTSSTAWSNAANWSSGLPTASTNVIINSGAPNMPLVDISTAACMNLTINTGATLGYNSTTNILNINGAVTNSGIFDKTSGKVVYASSDLSQPQPIEPGTYKDLQVSGGNNKTLSGSVTISNRLSLISGFIVLGNNNLVLGPSATVSGSSIVSFVVTDGSGGLTIQNVGTGGKTGTVRFSVGSTNTSYTPLAINNIGTSDAFTANVKGIVSNNYASEMATGVQQTTNAVNKTWFVKEAVAGGSNATLTVQWNSDDELPGFDHNACYLSHFMTYWNPAPAMSATGLDPFNTTLAGITSFSPFGVGSVGSILPVTLVAFKGFQKSSNIQLEWTTTLETNLKSFDIEKSVTGTNFVKAGTVSANGISNQNTNYQWTDEKPLNEKNYYRLKMTDRFGTIKYSTVVRVTINSKGEPGILVYPNPVEGRTLQLQLNHMNSGSFTIFLYNEEGRRVYTKKLNNEGNSGSFMISLPPSISRGSYRLQVQNSQSTFTKKIIVE